jgi:ribosomal protein S18 acetylase RimI-like enzyme
MTDAGFAIRAAQRADAGCLARLNATVHARHLEARPDFFKATQLQEVVDWFQSLLERPSTRCWLALADAEPVGYLLMREYQRPENVFCLARHWHEIDHVGVEAQYRGRGIGRALVQTALAAARGTGAREVELASWSFNAEAHAMFRRSGFVPRLLRFDLALSQR